MSPREFNYGEAARHITPVDRTEQTLVTCEDVLTASARLCRSHASLLPPISSYKYPKPIFKTNFNEVACGRRANRTARAPGDGRCGTQRLQARQQK
jgi:hypothetical protein